MRIGDVYAMEDESNPNRVRYYRIINIHQNVVECKSLKTGLTECFSPWEMKHYGRFQGTL